MEKNLNLLRQGLLGLCLAFLLSACGSGGPYIRNDSDLEIELDPSPHHRFTTVTLSREGRQLVLFCKLDHPQGFFQTEGHVDVVLLDASGSVLFRESLPVENRGGRRQRFQDASFTTRIPPEAAQGARIRLAFHETGSPEGQRLDCGAAPAGGEAQK